MTDTATVPGPQVSLPIPAIKQKQGTPAPEAPPPPPPVHLDQRKALAEPRWVSGASKVAGDFRRGYKTTEFWVALVGSFLTQVHALSLPGHNGRTITTLGLLGSYILSRGIAKYRTHE